jgi:hypothetical protein
MIEPVSRRRDQYRRWERSAAMELWQMDVTANLFLADGRECKVITGIDDHSRFCVIATVVMRATVRDIAGTARLKSFSPLSTPVALTIGCAPLSASPPARTARRIGP